jgi:sugar/nucleoside kinase (ribokinase family)
MKSGILAAGNFIVDTVKIIDTWPVQDSLCNIVSQSFSNGGGPYNILKDLALMKADFPLYALGCIGDDAWGNYILADCKHFGINTDLMFSSNSLPTSYTDVMTVKSNGRRTFFHNRGANAQLNPDHFQWDKAQGKIFHLAYLMLLDSLDKINESGVSNASIVLKKAKEHGFITSADVVSENSTFFKQTISSSLPYIDYLFLNEYEAEKITDIITSNNQEIDIDACEKACHHLLDMGVNKWVIMHFPKGALAISKKRQRIFQKSLVLPSDYIVGTVGAGDAFAAGCLYGIHQDWEMSKSLELAVSAAAACLAKPTCSDGLLPVSECLDLFANYLT